MALTRKFLTALGIEDEKIDQIIEAHTTTLSEIKTERDSYKAKAESLPEIQKQLDEANETIKNSKDDAYKAKYDELQAEFKAFKDDISAKEIKAQKESAYTALLKEIGVSDKRLATILKASAPNIDAVELDKDGKIVKADDLKNSLTEEWADFIVKEGKKGADTPNPENGGGVGDMTKEAYNALSLAEKMAYANEHPSEAQKFNEQE